MELLKPILYLSILTTILMIVINGLIYLSEKNRRYIHTFEFWCAYLFYFAISYFTEGYDPHVVALSTFVWIWRTRCIAIMLGDISDESLFKSWHTLMFAGAYTFGVLLAFAGTNFTIYTILPSLANFIIGLDIIKQTAFNLKKRGKIQMPHKLLLFTVFIISVHLLDYPFIRYENAYASFGFMVVLFTTIMMAILLPSVTILDLERVHKQKLEETLSKRMKQLEERSKLSALGEMTTGIFPEFNDPLSIISHRTSELRHKIFNDQVEKEAVLKSLNQIEATSERMSRVIHSLKKFGRDSKSSPLEMVAVASVVEDTLSYCVDRFQHAGILLDVEPYPVKNIECRSSQISQVLLNLLMNSFEAIQETRYAWIRISFEEGPTTIRIRLTDSGTGIQEQVRAKMFEPFFTTKVTGGNGLGLSIARSIIEEHQGKIFYDESSINTSFVVELPYRQSSI